MPEIKWWVIFGLLLSIAFVSTLNFRSMTIRRELQTGQTFEEFHKSFVDGTFEYPQKYRVLIPRIMEKLHSITSVPLKMLYVTYHLLMLWLTLAIFFLFLKIWVPDVYALLGTLMLAALYTSPTIASLPGGDVFELFLFSFAFYLMSTKLKLLFANLLLILLIFIGTFNKETTLFIAIAYTIFKWREFIKQKDIWQIIFIVLAVLAFVIPYALLRIFMGTGPYLFTLVNNLTNIQGWVLLVMFFGVILVYGIRNFSAKPVELRIFSFVMFLYFVVQIILGGTNELRIFVPILIALIPLFLINVKNPSQVPLKS